MPYTPLPIERILPMLAAAPARIAELARGLTPEQLRADPAPDEWSANDVLAHLRACADVWGSCIRTILAEDRPTFKAINPRAWITQTDYLDLDFQPSLRAFTAQRADLLAVLESLPREDWAREATVTGAGKPLVRTVLYYADSLAVHERPHLKQIARIASAMRG